MASPLQTFFSTLLPGNHHVELSIVDDQAKTPAPLLRRELSDSNLSDMNDSFRWKYVAEGCNAEDELVIPKRRISGILSSKADGEVLLAPQRRISGQDIRDSMLRCPQRRISDCKAISFSPAGGSVGSSSAQGRMGMGMADHIRSILDSDPLFFDEIDEEDQLAEEMSD